MLSNPLNVWIQKGVELNLPDWGTGIPDNDKRAHALRREPIYLSSRCLKSTSFQSEIQSNCF